MYISVPHLLSAALLLSTSVIANPLPNPNPTTPNQLEARRGAKCGSGRHARSFSNSAPQSTYDEGIARRRSGNLASGTYPREFRNGTPARPEVNPGHCEGLRLFEYPVLESGTYRGGLLGLDRVVFGYSDQRSGAFVQCRFMTHSVLLNEGLYERC